MVCHIDEGIRRLLWVGQNRKKATLNAFFYWFGDARAQEIRFVCSDMWQPDLDVIRLRASQALNILDRFHIVGDLNKAVDETRRKEAAELKRPANLTANQAP